MMSARFRYLKAVSLLSVCIFVNNVCATDLQRVSFHDLYSKPDRYDGKVIEIQGYLDFRPTDSGVFPSPNDASRGEGGVRLSVGQDEVRKRELYFNNETAMVSGLFTAFPDATTTLDARNYIGVLSGIKITTSDPGVGEDAALLEVSDKSVVNALESMSDVFNSLVKKREYSEIAQEAFEGLTAKEITAYADDIRQVRSRLGWVLYGASESIYSRLAENRAYEKKYYLVVPPKTSSLQTYLTCYLSVEERYKINWQNIGELNPIRSGSKSFCYEAYRKKDGSLHFYFEDQ